MATPEGTNTPGGTPATRPRRIVRSRKPRRGKPAKPDKRRRAGTPLSRATLSVGMALLALLPLRAAHVLGDAVGWVAGRWPSRSRHAAHVNLGFCFPDWRPEARQATARASVRHVAKAFAELGAMWRWEGKRTLALVREVRGETLIEQARAAGRGVVVASPHLGSWEIVGLYLSARYPITSLYRAQGSALDAEAYRGRSRLGARMVAAGPKGVRALYQALEAGNLVGLLPDRNPGLGSGVFAPLFGVQANTGILMPRLAHRTGAVCLFAYAERLPRGAGFRIHILPAPDGLDHPDEAYAARRMNQGIERCVRRLPEQYWWAYRRFRKRPKGEPKIY